MKTKLKNNRNQPQSHKGTKLKNRYLVILGVLVPWRQERKGSAFLIVVFIAALLAVLVAGMLQMATEQIQLMRNQIYAAEALATAEAGMNDAFAEIREDDEWDEGFEDKSFAGGSYSVDVDEYDGDGSSDLTIISEGISSQGFVARVAADITVGTASPYIIRIDNLRINDNDDD